MASTSEVDYDESFCSSTRESDVSTNNNTSHDITFEGQWEEDDLVALSGHPGHSFQKISASDPRLTPDTSRRILALDLPADIDVDTIHGFTESELDDMATPDELQTPEELDSPSPRHNSSIDLEWDNDTPVVQPIKAVAVDEVKANNASVMWRTVLINDKNYKLDLAAVMPYRQVLSHGGYYGEGLNAVVVFSACYLPDIHQTDYRYIMDNLFLYVVSTLDLLVAEDYMIIFLNGGCRRKNLPSLNWLKKCYQMIHRRLRKNLKQVVIVHPSWYIRLLIGFFRPFISSKFTKKIKLVSSLHKLADIVTLDSVTIPDAVQEHDLKLLNLSTSSKLQKVNESTSSSEQSSTSSDIKNGGATEGN